MIAPVVMGGSSGLMQGSCRRAKGKSGVEGFGFHLQEPVLGKMGFCNAPNCGSRGGHKSLAFGPPCGGIAKAETDAPIHGDVWLETEPHLPLIACGASWNLRSGALHGDSPPVPWARSAAGQQEGECQRGRQQQKEEQGG